VEFLRSGSGGSGGDENDESNINLKSGASEAFVKKQRKEKTPFSGESIKKKC
jgi:hypothetical protein